MLVIGFMPGERGQVQIALRNVSFGLIGSGSTPFGSTEWSIVLLQIRGGTSCNIK